MAGRDLVVRFLGDAAGLGSSVDGVSSKMSTFGKVAAGLGTAVAGGVVAAGKGLYEIGATFDNVSDTIRTQTGATGTALDGLVSSAKSVGTQVPSSFDDVGVAVAGLNQRLGLTGPKLEGMAAQVLDLSRLTGTDLAGNVETVSRLFGNWGIEAGDMSDSMDKLFVVSQKTGISFDDLASNMQKFGEPLRQLGFSFDQSAALIGKLEQSGANTEKVLGALGKALGTMAKDGEQPIATFQRIVQSIKDAGDQAAANAIAVKLFGTKAGPELAGAIRSGKLAVDDLVGSLAGSGGAIQSASEDTADFAEQWQLFKNKAFVALEPVAARVFNLLGTKMEEMGTWFSENEDTVMEFADTIGSAFDALISIIEVVLPVLAKLAPIIAEWAPAILGFWAAVKVIKFAQWAKESTGAISKWGTDIIGHFRGVSASADKEAKKTKKSWKAIGLAGGALGGLAIAGAAFGEEGPAGKTGADFTFGEKLKDTLDTANKLLSLDFKGVWDKLVRDAGPAWEFLNTTIPNGFRTALNTAAAAAWEWASVTVPDAVRSGLGVAAQAVWEWGSVTVPEAVRSGLTAAGLAVWHWASVTVPESVRSGLGAAALAVWNWASITVPESIRGGLTAAGQAVWQWASVTVPESVRGGLDTAGQAVWQWASVTVPDSVRNGLTAAGEAVWQWASVTVPDSVRNGLAAAGQAVLNWASVTVPDAVRSGLSAAADGAARLGQGIVEGIGRALQAGWQWLKDLVSGLAQSLFTAAKNALGIASPSKKFRWVGMQVCRGFAKGIDQNRKLVAKATGGLMKATSIAPTQLARWGNLTTRHGFGGGSMASITRQGLVRTQGSEEPISQWYHRGLQAGGGAAGGGQAPIRLDPDSALARLIMELIRKQTRTRGGGDAQLVIGRA